MKFRQFCLPKRISWVSLLYFNTILDGQYFRQQARYTALLSAEILSDEVCCIKYVLLKDCWLKLSYNSDISRICFILLNLLKEIFYTYPPMRTSQEQEHQSWETALRRDSGYVQSWRSDFDISPGTSVCGLPRRGIAVELPMLQFVWKVWGGEWGLRSLVYTHPTSAWPASKEWNRNEGRDWKSATIHCKTPRETRLVGWNMSKTSILLQTWIFSTSLSSV